MLQHSQATATKSWPSREDCRGTKLRGIHWRKYWNWKNWHGQKMARTWSLTYSSNIRTLIYLTSASSLDWLWWSSKHNCIPQRLIVNHKAVVNFRQLGIWEGHLTYSFPNCITTLHLSHTPINSLTSLTLFASDGSTFVSSRRLCSSLKSASLNLILDEGNRAFE